MEFWFDDGWEGDYSSTLPFLLKNGCTGIAALVTDWVCKPGFLCPKKIRALIGSGWKIASHGTNHKPMLDMDLKQTRQVLRDSKTWIKANLGVEPYAFVAPWNVMRPEQAELALEYYNFVREPKTLHFNSNNFTDVRNTVTKILQGGDGAMARIEHHRYLKSRACIKQRFGVDV